MASIRKLKNKRFLVEIRKRGVYKSQTFSSKVAAMAWAVETEQALDNTSLILGKTLKDAYLRYQKEKTPSKKSFKSEYNRLNKLAKQPLADLTLSEIEQADIYEWIEQSLRPPKRNQKRHSARCSSFNRSRSFVETLISKQNQKDI